MIDKILVFFSDWLKKFEFFFFNEWLTNLQFFSSYLIDDIHIFFCSVNKFKNFFFSINWWNFCILFFFVSHILFFCVPVNSKILILWNFAKNKWFVKNKNTHPIKIHITFSAIVQYSQNFRNFWTDYKLQDFLYKCDSCNYIR